jgi:hypothetical protein
LVGADTTTRIATAAVLASQGAKGKFRSDLRTFWEELESDDAFRREMVTKRPALVRRFRPRQDRRGPLPVEAARAVPILDLFERYGHQLRRVGAEWMTRCPFHEDRRPSLRVRSAKGMWYCDPCGVGGDGLGFVMRLKGIDFAGAVREVAA